MFTAEAARQGVTQRAIAPKEIVERCLYALINEGADVLAEGIAARAGDIDVVYVNGYGFPAARGGPMYAADQIGPGNMFKRIEAMRERFGGHWRPSPLLKRLAETRGKFGDNIQA
jgi:3-hydroxyacyl-CoA dehydrogenase